LTKTTEEQGEEPELHISIHALSGVCSKAKTFPLFVPMDDVKLVALIDSGCATTFLNPSVIEKVGLSVTKTVPEKVTVAN
jgi:hypothetical protein